MSTHLVTGYAGQEHITASDQGSFNMALMGDGQFVMDRGSKMAASVISNNKVRIADGDILMQGRHIRIKENTYEELNFSNGTQGLKRNDLIVCRYSKDAQTGVESASIVVIEGTPTDSTPDDPDYTVGDITELTGDLLNDMPLYRVPFDGLNIQELVCLFDVLPTLDDQLDELVQKVDNAIDEKLSGGVATTVEESAASTNPEMLVGTGALNGLNTALGGQISGVVSDLGGLKFGTDGDGNYGYYGADGSLVPFKSGGGLENPIIIKSGDWSTDTSYTFTSDYSTVIFIVNTGSAKNGIPTIPDTTVKLNGTTITKVMQINSQTYASNIYGRVGTHLYVLNDVKSGDKVTMTNTIAYGAFGQ